MCITDIQLLKLLQENKYILLTSNEGYRVGINCRVAVKYYYPILTLTGHFTKWRSYRVVDFNHYLSYKIPFSKI